MYLAEYSLLGDAGFKPFVAMFLGGLSVAILIALFWLRGYLAQEKNPFQRREK